MNRQNYLDALKISLEPNIVSHSLALEACMGGIYDYLSQNNLLKPNELSREDWSLAGLIHDIDYAALKAAVPDIFEKRLIEVMARFEAVDTRL